MRIPLRRGRRALAALGTAATAALIVGGAAAGSATAVVAPFSAHIAQKHLHAFAAPPTHAECAADGLLCYTPQQMQRAYDMGPLYAKGDTGRGKTVFIVDSFGSPTIQHDLAVFDAAYHLPTAHLTVVQPSGRVPAFDPTNDDMVGWAEETTLDVELAHTMAPGARIVLAETPVSETEGLTGLPEIMHAEQWGIRHHLADVITQSFGAGEGTFDHPKSDIESVRYAFKEAYAKHVTVLASSGDAGPEDYDRTGTTLEPYYQASWPASDPLVTSVGGTTIRLNDAGVRTQPDEAWNESSVFGEAVASGGGRSAVFARPGYQNGVASTVHGSRGYPDISMSAAVLESPILYWSFEGAGVTGFILGNGGTSASSPLMAGFVAVADQAAGRDLGLLNPTLYRLMDRRGSGEVDVTIGNTDVPDLKGFDAVRGYDLATGWGTIDGAKLAKALAKACKG